MKKRNILTVALALCLIAIMACGTLAYFTSTKEVINTFKTSTVDPSTDTNGDGEINDKDDPIADDVFSIKLYETDIDSASTDATTTEGNTYDGILPGDVLTKNPTVENTGAYPAYVRMSVVVNEAEDWKAAIAKNIENGNIENVTSIDDFDLEAIFGGYNNEWECKEVTEDTTADTLTYVYYLNAPLEVDATSTLFETVTIPACFDADDMISLKEFELTITADAIQTMNTGDQGAYYAFTNYWEEYVK